MRKGLLNSLSLGILIAFFNGCSSSDEIILDCASSGLMVEITSVTSATCGLSDGSIFVSAIGVPPFTYSIDGVTFQESTTFSQLASGNYEITVKDANECTATTTTTVTNDTNLVFTTEIVASGCKTSNGSISISATGGAGGYTYQLDNGGFQSDPAFTALAAGIYEITVMDVNGCVTTDTKQVLSGITWSGQIENIMNTRCAITGCHVAGTGLPQWSILGNVQQNAQLIKTRTSTMSMPPPGATDLTAEQIAQIACWVDDGALNN